MKMMVKDVSSCSRRSPRVEVAPLLSVSCSTICASVAFAAKFCRARASQCSKANLILETLFVCETVRERERKRERERGGDGDGEGEGGKKGGKERERER